MFGFCPLKYLCILQQEHLMSCVIGTFWVDSTFLYFF